MPADRSEHRVGDREEERPAAGPGADAPERVDVAGRPVVVRRNAGVAALVGGAASTVAIAYLWRAAQTMAPFDWALFGAMGLIAATYLVALVDARTPLLVADDLGVRIRLGHEWRGLPWEAVGQVVVHPRRGPLRDGRLVFAPRSLARALDGVEGKARRQVVLNQKMYGAPLAVPLGATTRLSTARRDDVADEIEALARGRAEVVVLDPRTLEAVDRSLLAPAAQTPVAPAPESDGDEDAPSQRREVFPRVHEDAIWGISRDGEGTFDEAPQAEAPVLPGDGTQPSATGSQRRGILGGIGTVVSRVAKGRPREVAQRDPDTEVASGAGTGVPDAEATPPAPASPVSAAALRETRPGLRAEATLDLAGAGSGSSTAEADEAAPATDGRELRRPGNVDLVFERVDVDDRIRPISTLGDPVEPLVIGDYATEPAYDPVIGPELTAARTRLGLSVDDLAERTRIRPHVIESIEVDDFAPCGGDFYARGHLRTLARILGKDPEPLLRTFEERYAAAPINARRVFEAELATGMTGSMRSTVGGPSWSLLLGVALVLLLVWGVLRLVTTEPTEAPTPLIHGAASVRTVDGAPAGDHLARQ